MRSTKQRFIFITFFLTSLIYSSQIFALDYNDPYTDYLDQVEEEKALADGIQANPDSVTIFASDKSTTGSVTANDTGYTSANLISSRNGKCGILVFDSTGGYTYTVQIDDTEKSSDCTDQFTYQIEITGKDKHTDRSTLTIHILASIEEDSNDFYAVKDSANITRDINALNSTVEGNVLTNDITKYVADDDTKTFTLEFIYAADQTPNMGKYGSLVYNNVDGTYTYTLFNGLDEIQELNFNESIIDVFTYKIETSDGKISETTLAINIFGALGTVDDFVEIEPNNRSGSGCNSGDDCVASLGVATELNLSSDESINIRGHLQNSLDKDWFSIDSSGNEIIHLELCPQGTNCYDEKSWVMYVFDGDKLSKSIEDTRINFRTYGDTTGWELTGLSRKNTSIYNVDFYSYEYLVPNHMYLNYNFGIFEDSIIGIIDPCYGKTSALDIGVGEPKTYYIAISSPLARGDGSTKGGGTACGDDSYGGSVFLLKDGPSHSYPDPTFNPSDPANNPPASDPAKVADIVTESTSQEYISVEPNSDDQYTIRVRRTGHAPVPTGSTRRSATFNDKSNTLTIPNLRIGTKIYTTDFGITDQTKRSSTSILGFQLIDFAETDNVLTANDGSATFNPETSLLRISNYLHTDGVIYSLALYYHPATENSEHWFELVKVDKAGE